MWSRTSVQWVLSVFEMFSCSVTPRVSWGWVVFSFIVEASLSCGHAGLGARPQACVAWKHCFCFQGKVLSDTCSGASETDYKTWLLARLLASHFYQGSAALPSSLLFGHHCRFFFRIAISCFRWNTKVKTWLLKHHRTVWGQRSLKKTGASCLMLLMLRVQSQVSHLGPSLAEVRLCSHYLLSDRTWFQFVALLLLFTLIFWLMWCLSDFLLRILLFVISAL